ncbi:MAG: 4Fe-4S binding protein [Desulfohalobiaceae bacterium]
MQINELSLVYFSPTSTTRQVLEHIAQGLGVQDIQRLDLTLPDSEKQDPVQLQGDLALLGVPVYGGRVPSLAARRMQQIQAQGMPAVLVVVYGNRAYEDALLELKDLAEGWGFLPVAGGAFIAEHSFATQDTPIANGRPDARDRELAEDFGTRIRELLSSAASARELPQLQVPGNRPYKEPPKHDPAAPEADPQVCILCGTCAESCPSGAIKIDSQVQADPALCIFCQACVKNCPTGAMTFQAQPLLELASKLSRNCQIRQEPETYLPEAG